MHIPQAPDLEYICELQVALESAMVVGETALGTRRVIPITGGTVEVRKSHTGIIAIIYQLVLIG